MQVGACQEISFTRSPVCRGGRIEVISYDGSIGSEILDEYHRKSGMSYAETSGMSYFLALESGIPVGIIGFTGDRIKLLYAVDSAPEQTERDLLKAVIADATYRGAPSVSIYSLDVSGRGYRACKDLGFKEDVACPCRQRAGTVYLKMTFR